jgi:hypothetical protein
MTDDQGNPTGEVRLCYCFGNGGRGAAKAVWSNGVRCRGALQARIYSDRLVMKHRELTCRGPSDHNIYPGEIECKGTTEGNSTVCDWSTHGAPHTGDDDKYQRVPPERCN